jgi:hypothetical protein
MERAEPTTTFEGLHCTFEIARPRERVVVITIAGTDVGELGDAPFRALEGDVAEERSVQLFIDARRTRGASIDVSGEWARWLREHRAQLLRVTMLPGSRFIRITAEFVRRFSGLDDRMWVSTAPAAFDAALASALRGDEIDGAH